MRIYFSFIHCDTLKRVDDKKSMRICFDKYDDLVLISTLKPSRFQRNQHPTEQIERLAKIMLECGIHQPIHVSRLTGEICFGHGRLEAAKLNGWDKFPVTYQRFENETEEYLCVQSDNALSTWSELNLSQINLDLKDIGPFDIDLLGIKDFKVDISEINYDQELEQKQETIYQCQECGALTEKSKLVKHQREN